MKFIVTVALIIIMVNLSFSDEIYFKNGYIYKNVRIIDSTNNIVKVQIDKDIKYFDLSGVDRIFYTGYKSDYSSELISPETKTINQNENFYTEIRLLTGEKINGRYISSTDSTATYQTDKDSITLQKRLILSVNKINKNAIKETKNISKTKLAIKEYRSLPLLILTVGGGIGAFALLKKASDYEDAATALKLLNFTKEANDASSEAGGYRAAGIVVAGISVVSFFFAIKPTEIEVDKNFSIIPQGNRITLTYKY